MSRRTLFAAVSALLTLVLVGGSSTPSVAKPRPPYKISIEASDTTVAVGQEIVFTGKVRPASTAVTKQDVKLQVVYDEQVGFETARLDEPNRKGKYEISLHFTEFSGPGTYRVRARIAAGKGHSEGISEELTITVT
jgi:hypothetical protein